MLYLMVGNYRIHNIRLMDIKLIIFVSRYGYNMEAIINSFPKNGKVGIIIHNKESESIHPAINWV